VGSLGFEYSLLIVILRVDDVEEFLEEEICLVPLDDCRINLDVLTPAYIRKICQIKSIISGRYIRRNCCMQVHIFGRNPA
jgi:hypothetical protein